MQQYAPSPFLCRSFHLDEQLCWFDMLQCLLGLWHSLCERVVAHLQRVWPAGQTHR